MRRGGGGRTAGGSDSEELSYDVYSDSSDEDDALFNAALAQTPSPSAARALHKGGRKGIGSSPSPRAPPPTRSLGGPSGKLVAPANPPPVQMPAGEAGGLRAETPEPIRMQQQLQMMERISALQTGFPRRAGAPAPDENSGAKMQIHDVATSSRAVPPANALRAALPASSTAALSAFRNNSPLQEKRLWEQTPSPETSGRNGRHVLDNEPSMGGYSQQVPENVAAHTIISPVLSQPRSSPDSSSGTPRAVSRDRWPLPPLPQRTPPRGRMNGDAGDDSVMSEHADVVVMSDVPGRTTIPPEKRREDLQQLQYERARSRSRDRRRVAGEEEGGEEESYVARPYRDDDTMGLAHQRIMQRKEAEDKLHDRLMGHLQQLPSRRETELARAARAPIDAPPSRDHAEEEERAPRDVRRALMAAGKANAQGGVVAIKSTLSPSSQTFRSRETGYAGMNSSSVSGMGERSYDPAHMPLAPPSTVIDRGKPGANSTALPLNPRERARETEAPRSDVSRSAPDVDRGKPGGDGRAPAITPGQPSDASRPGSVAGADVGEPVVVAVTLNLDLNKVGDVEAFKRDVASDVSRALELDAHSVKVLRLRAGSIIVDLEITPHARFNGRDLHQALLEQAKDTRSALMSGKYTRKTLAISPPCTRSDGRRPASVARGETPDMERGEGEKRRTSAAVAEAVAHTEDLLHAKLLEAEGAHEVEKDQLIAQAAEHRERVGELLDMLRQAEATAAEENRFHEEATQALQRRVSAVEKAGVSLATSLEAMTSERDALQKQRDELQKQLEDTLKDKQEAEAAREEEVAALKAMVRDAKDELAQQSEDYAHLEEQTTELMRQVKHMEELHMDVHADYESAMASSRELEDRLRDAHKERDELKRDNESGKRHADDQGNALREALRQTEERARKAEEEVRACKRQIEEQKRQVEDMESQRRQSDRINAELKRELEQTMAAREEQSKDMELLRRQSDRINTELKRDLEQTMALSEDLKNQLREMSNSREETREEVQSLQKHAAKLEAALQEHDHDIALQKTQVRNAQGRIASLERELDTAQDLVNIAEGKVSNMAHEKKELERENGELTSQVYERRKEFTDLQDMEENLSSQLQMCQRQLKSAQVQVEALERENEACRTDLSSTRRQGKELELELTEAQAQVQQLSRQLERERAADRDKDSFRAIDRDKDTFRAHVAPRASGMMSARASAPPRTSAPSPTFHVDAANDEKYLSPRQVMYLRVITRIYTRIYTYLQTNLNVLASTCAKNTCDVPTRIYTHLHTYLNVHTRVYAKNTSAPGM